MDNQKIYRRIGIIGLVNLLLLVWASPVAADPPINDEWHVNSVEVDSGELPAGLLLPSLPSPVTMPRLELPYVTRDDWPTTVDEREAVKLLVRNRVTVFQQSLNNRYTAARVAVNAMRSTTDMISNAVGDPMTTVSANTGERSLTVTGMAQEMAQSVEFSLGYARAVAEIGPVGLDLVFAFVGLAWIVFINVMSLLVRLIAWFIRMLGRALEAIWKVFMLLIQIIRLVIAIF